MKKAAVMMGLTLLLTWMTATAFAGPGMWGGGFYGAGPVAPNLTQDQSSQIIKLQQAHLEEITPIQQQLLAKKTELRSQWLTPNPEPEKVRALEKEILELVGKLQEKNTNLRLDMMKVIQP